MRQKLHVMAVVGVCLALVLGVAMATERGRDNSADRSKRGMRGATVDSSRELGYTGSVGFSEQLARQRGEPGARESIAARDMTEKASNYLSLADQAKDADTALAYLIKVLDLDLSDSPARDKILMSTYLRTAELYEYAPQKQIHFLAIAGQYASSEGLRRSIESRIEGLGGQAAALTLGAAGSAILRDYGVADFCYDALPTTGFAVVGDLWLTTGINIEAGGDGEWYAIDVATGDPEVGLLVRIQTISDTPADPLDDDTRLWLYDGCNEDGTGDVLIGYNDDRITNPDPGCVDPTSPFTSCLTSGCLPVGTHYLEVTGWWPGLDRDQAIAVDNVDLEIEVVGTCTVIIADQYEPDNDKANATEIGHSTASNNPNAIFTGRVAQEIQAHSIFPAGDQDWNRIKKLKKDSLMRIRTACGFPTIFNDFAECENPPAFDTLLDLWYTSPVSTYGVCNQSFTGVPGQIDGRSANACTNDLDCDFNGNGIVYPTDLGDLRDPFPGLPACLPWEAFPPGGTPINPVDNPLAFSDDGDFPVNLGADLTLCLPRTDRKSSSLSVQADPATEFNWYLRTFGWSPAGTPEMSNLEFNYEIFAHNMANCRFETEPNNAFDMPVDVLRLGESIHGIWDFSATQPDPDFDLFAFDLDETSELLFEIDGFDPWAVDSFLEIWVGPDENGDFFLVAENDDLSVGDFRSQLQVVLPPACEALPGVLCPDGIAEGKSESEAGYYVNVTGAYIVPNFPYELKSTVLATGVPGEDLELVSIRERLDFGDCEEPVPAEAMMGDVVRGDFNAVCDYDGVNFSLMENTFISFSTGPAGQDTVIELRDCDTNEVLGCDDDGGPGFLSLLEGCLPGGRNYCVRVRQWTGVAGPWSLTLGGGESCEAEDPPVLIGGGGLCGDDFGVCP